MPRSYCLSDGFCSLFSCLHKLCFNLLFRWLRILSEIQIQKGFPINLPIINPILFFCHLLIGIPFFPIQKLNLLFRFQGEICSLFFIKNYFHRVMVSHLPCQLFHLLPLRGVKWDCLFIKNRILTFDKDQTILSVHSFDRRRSHQTSPQFLVLNIGVSVCPKCPPIIPDINGHLPQQLRNIFVGTLGSWSGSHIDCDCTVLHKNLPLILLKQGFDLRNGLQNRGNRNIPSPDRSHQRFRFTWFWSCIKFIGPQSDMNGQCPSTFMICRMDQHIKHGGIKHGNQKIKRRIVVWHDQKQRRLFPRNILCPSSQTSNLHIIGL